MGETAAQKFVELVKRSQLVEEEQLERFLAKLRTENGGKLPEKQEVLATALVEAELLTTWQSEKLLAGKHRGFILGKYKLLSMLGKGGMSSVYLAEHILMRARRAIKVLPKNKVADSTYLDRFRIEARAAAKLDDPNIIHTYDIDEHDGQHYLVMEYVEGQDLHQLVKEKGPLDYLLAADYIAQVARGLSHAHEMGLVHRDIKPANCLLDKNGVVKLLDLGLARLIDDEASLTLDNNENVLGTADYLAPEQALDSHKADSRSDVYSLGCTLYFLLTGHPPFPDGSISERLLKHQVEKAPSILKDRPDAPPILLHICETMMAKKPAERYQTADDVVDRLAEWLADRGRDVGDSGKNLDSKGGVGSDVFRRFAQSINRGSDSGGSSSPEKSAKQLLAPTVEREPEEDIGLAPIEEESEPEESEEFNSAGESTTDDITSAMAETVNDKPRVSLVEEAFELAEKKEKTKPRPRSLPGEIDPLRPPGFSGPRYGPPGWVYALAAVGVLAVLIVGLAIAFSG
ncbi:serine/threonine-protein kinase [Bythopirellula polymerisocia]|uniref:non-specific serine/threonine protein kinase n=1 Tax=Bythopirellula polymerisocia TaxID=2528003 RepID=A0A5C6CR66_9BACT|nr:serine/threonine-protein kinase [Bythopirellula polymerisocia]TWU25921.1 Serine/threonine-protein kinase PrkC [Bythopirellula polymerisocia]